MTREDIIEKISDLIRENAASIWDFDALRYARSVFLLWEDGEITCETVYRSGYIEDVYAKMIYSIEHINFNDVFGAEDILEVFLRDFVDESDAQAFARVLRRTGTMDYKSIQEIFGDEALYSTEDVMAECQREECIREEVQRLEACDNFLTDAEMEEINAFLLGGE